MKFLALERETQKLKAENAAAENHPFLLRAEARRAWELYQEGIIRELYFRSDQSLAVLVLECPDVQAAWSALNSLPLVEAGQIEFELIPLKAYPGFARLFSSAADEPPRP